MMINSHSVWIPDKQKLTKKIGNGHSNAVAIFGQNKTQPKLGLLG
jgi:hypothetical protein